MDKWIVKKYVKKLPKLKNTTLIEGLPGMGQVGKIAADFLIDQLNTTLLYKIYSYEFSHSVYLNEHSELDLPSTNIHYYSNKGNNFIIVSGDEQPATRRGCYQFADKILDIAEELGCKNIITLGGLGLTKEVKTPNIFGAVTHSSVLKQYKKIPGINFTTSKKIDAIVGVSGLLLGLANLRGIKGVALLTETYAHPSHLGLLEAKTVLSHLKKMFDLDINLKDLDVEIKQYNKDKLNFEKELHTNILKDETPENVHVRYIG